jgi:hypothetical protein
MTRRPAVTLIEVLVTMFIMAIGMLALLTLFPLGAISMGQALKDDRCASTAAMAENVAIAMNIRHDSGVLTGFATSGGGPVYVDPYGFLQGLTPVGGVIPRAIPSFIASAPPGQAPAYTDRWFSLPDDITFLENGTPDLTSAVVERGRRYSYTYLLRRPQPLADNLVQLFVVVYSGRPIGALTLEQTYVVTPVSVNGLTLAWAAGQPPVIKRGGWILDTTAGGAGLGNFYRVTNIVDTSAVSMTVEVEPNLIGNVGAVTVMDNVAEVFDKGTSWQP